MSWNVNGLRACARTHFRDWFRRADADVVAIQELRAEPDQVDPDLVDLDGYSSFFFPAQRKGYAGTAAWVRNTMGTPQVLHGIGHSTDHEGRVLRLDLNDLTVLGIYAINGGRDQQAFDDKLDFFSLLRSHLQDLVAKGRKVVLVGDYNICHHPIDIADPVGNRDAVGFRPVEREALSALFDAGFADCFRRLHPRQPAHYTWWSNRPGIRARNHGWRIDYAAVSEDLWPRARHCWHEPDQMGSDHCPVGLELA